MVIIFDNIIYSLQKSGGGSVYWTELIKRFDKSTENDIRFYEHEGCTENIFRKNISLNNITSERFSTLRIRRYLNFTKKVDFKFIFHSSYYRISKSRNAINVTSIHDFTTEKFRKGIAGWINLQQKKYAVKNSDGIICISENTKRDLLHFIPKIDNEKIKVIYNGVSEDFYYIEKDFKISEIDKKFEGLQNFKYLLYVGHRTAYKNFDLALKAVSEVKAQYKFVIIGEPFNNNEQALIKKFIGNNFLQISKLDNVGLNFLYNKAFALIYPSSYEGFGIPILEAMKTHCPVIASDTSSIPEVAGEAAVLLHNINSDLIVTAIKKLENTKFRQNLISKGILQSCKFNWDKTFQLYLDFYQKLYDAR